MGKYDIDIKRSLMWPIFFLIALMFIGMQLNGLALETNISNEYISFYQNTLNLAAWSLVLLVFSNLYLETRLGDILGISTTNKAIMFFGFFAFIMLLTVGSGQVLPIPRASAQPLQLNSGTEIITSALIPAFTEDALYLMALPAIMLTMILGFMEWAFGRPSPTQAIMAVILACIIATSGFNIWVIPGFTSAHVPAYGEQQSAYLGAWIYGFGQSMVYILTGWLAPITHFAHNALIVVNQMYNLNIGNLIVTGA